MMMMIRMDSRSPHDQPGGREAGGRGAAGRDEWRGMKEGKNIIFDWIVPRWCDIEAISTDLLATTLGYQSATSRLPPGYHWLPLGYHLSIYRTSDFGARTSSFEEKLISYVQKVLTCWRSRVLQAVQSHRTAM